MQKRVAPASLAASARERTSSSGTSFSRSTPGVVTNGLRAVGAVFRAGASLDREQRAHLHGVRLVVRAMGFLRAEHEIGERQGEESFDFGDRPVVASRSFLFLVPWLYLLIALVFRLAGGGPAPKPGHVRQARIHCQPLGVPAVDDRATLVEGLAATLFPPRCCLCGFPGASLDLDLCGFCQADLPWELEHLPGTVVAMRFAPPADELIRDLKYRGITPNARVLGVLLAQAVQQRGAPLPACCCPCRCTTRVCASAASTRRRRLPVTQVECSAFRARLAP